MFTTEEIIAVIGWIGVTCCTLGFLLLNLKVLRFDSHLYQIINVIGGMGLVTSAYYFRDLPNIASNSMWVLIGVYGLYRSLQLRKKED